VVRARDGGDELVVTAAMADTVTVAVRPVELEMLFSAEPFALISGNHNGAAAATSGPASRFSFIRANEVRSLPVPPLRSDGAPTPVVLPLRDDLTGGRACAIEVTSTRGLRRYITHFPTKLRVRVAEEAGRIIVRRADGRPLPRAYVKVYASAAPDGSAPFFFKDGYTSAAGDFEYATVSTDALARAKLFAILVSAKDLGAVVRSAKPPASS
jgi:hypothetical protein